MNLTILGWVVTPIISAAFGWIIASIQSGKKETTALKLGVQALLRDRLLQGYKHYSAKGYADVDDRMNWMNLYEQYHNLGKNGVMDDTKDKFLKLPTQKPIKVKGEKYESESTI